MMENVLEVKDLVVRFDTDDGIVRAINGISFSIGKERTLGLVGETGAGKTTTVRLIDGLLRPAEGRVLFITSALKGAVDDMDTTDSRAAMDLVSQVIVVPQSRFYTAITLGSNGYTRRAASGSGATAVTAGKDINFMLIQKDAVIQYQKHIAPKIVTPEQNQRADAWKFGYRTVGIADVYASKVAGIYCHSQA